MPDTPPTPTDPAERLAALERDVAELTAILAELWVDLTDLPEGDACAPAIAAARRYEAWQARRRPERRG